jgi:demethylmenaquinone methyltransferase/2-methoxy-6-polyprenyl-1,4-benzoquinol methylase
MKENKNHWYDGWFYDKFIAPNQDRLFGKIRKLIEPNSKIIDVGCGTGRFPFFIADQCKSVKGIDLSKRNIDTAKIKLSKNPRYNISVEHKSVKDIIKEGREHFDYAVSTYVIHEVDKNERINLLKGMSDIADKIIIGDYLYPEKSGLWNLLNELVEFAAGRNHYKNYKSYMANGGISKLASQAGLRIIVEIKDKPLTSHLVILSK